jgi:hypothetical protein
LAIAVGTILPTDWVGAWVTEIGTGEVAAGEKRRRDSPLDLEPVVRVIFWTGESGAIDVNGVSGGGGYFHDTGTNTGWINSGGTTNSGK